MNIELWKLLLSGGVLLITAVTGPIVIAMRAEAKAIRAEMGALRVELRGDIETLRVELKGEIELARVELKGEIAKTEGRLNERISTRLVHR
jgi:hypothetical protein